MLDGQAQALTQKVVELALAGDMAALKLCIERLIPIRKDRAVHLPLPTIAGATDIPSGIAAVLQAVAEGELTPTEGHTLCSVFDLHRRAIETAELEARVAALESGGEPK